MKKNLILLAALLGVSGAYAQGPSKDLLFKDSEGTTSELHAPMTNTTGDKFRDGLTNKPSMDHSPGANKGYPALEKANQAYNETLKNYKSAYDRMRAIEDRKEGIAKSAAEKKKELIFDERDAISISSSEDEDDARLQLRKAEAEVNAAWGNVSKV